MCTRLTFWKFEKLSKLKDLVDRTDTDDPEETEDTPEIMSKYKWENRNNEFLVLIFLSLVFMRICEKLKRLLYKIKNSASEFRNIV